MHHLGFLHLKNKSDFEIELITDLWQSLGATNTSRVNAYHVLVLLAGVMNIHLPRLLQSQINSDNSHTDHIMKGHICVDKDGNNPHFRSDEEITQLFNKYTHLAINRHHWKVDKDKPKGEQYSFKP